MEESKFDKLQRFFLNALDRMGANYELLEMGSQPNNFYLKVDVDGTQYELSEVNEIDMAHDCACQCSSADPCRLDEGDRRAAIALSQRVFRDSKRY